MRKYLAILGVLIGSILCLCGCSDSVGGVYETVLPRGYDDSISEYPVIYVLPQNGYDLDDSRITELLDEEIQEGNLTDAIIIKPQFTEESDVLEEMKWIVQDVDSRYATIDNKKYRILVGTGTGGYLSYSLGLAERDLFGGMISIRGDFASEENPWIETFGSVSEEIEKVKDFGAGYFDEVYTYLDAPVDDAWSDMEGSTNDLGAMFIEMGTSSAAHEYTVRPGEFDKEFLQESVRRVSDNLTEYMLGSTITGTVKLENATLPEDEKTAKVMYSVDVANTINDFTLRDFEMEVTVSVIDPETEEVLSENSEVIKVTDDGTYDGEIEVDNKVNDTSSEVILTANIFGGKLELADATLRRGQGNVLEGDGKWAKGYGNIDENTVSGPSEHFTYMVTGMGAVSEDTNAEDANVDDGKGSVADVREYFYEETFESELIEKGEYLIYLPHDYYETERFYPTMYLLHQFNSDYTSYKTDHIDQVLNEGIEKGLFDEMIVVIPNSEKESWWTGKWEQMLTEELIPHIDSKYRTINDARYRMAAGCCMGGQGAFGVALTNPEYFSGVASFFGALSMAPTMAEDAILIAGEKSKEYLDYYSYSFICGNQDSYGFGIPAIDLHQILAEKEVGHYFFIENGGHDSEFYVPYFNECVGYVRSNMYQADAAVDRLVDVSSEVDGTKVKVNFEAAKGIVKYFNVIPASADAEESTAELNIPLIIQIVKDGEVIQSKTIRKNVVSTKKMSAEYEVDFSKQLEGVEDFEVVVKAAVFDRIVEFK